MHWDQMNWINKSYQKISYFKLSKLQLNKSDCDLINRIMFEACKINKSDYIKQEWNILAWKWCYSKNIGSIIEIPQKPWFFEISKLNNDLKL